MKISVTQDHINHGARTDCELCPIALAIAEAIPGSMPQVGSDDIRFTANGENHFVTTDDIPGAVDFIYAFDDGVPVEPFEFELPLPDQSDASAVVEA